ncbi:MAG: hypothetical protein R2725_03295 [Solirubrobacterales bacterium]
MQGNLRALGLALLAVFALSALAAQGASAHVFTSDSESERTVLTGRDEPETNNVLTVAGAEVQCENAHFEGTVEGSEANEVTVRPEYTDCLFAGNEAVVHTNDCAEILHSSTAEGHATVDVECAEGDEIEVTVPVLGITITVAEQADLSGVHYTNVAEGVTVEATLEGIHMVCIGNEFWCHFIFGSDTTAFAETSGLMEVVGYEDEGNNGTATTPDYVEGQQVDIAVS